MSITENSEAAVLTETSIYYAEAVLPQQIANAHPSHMQGLTLQLPAGSSGTVALVTLNVTAPYATGGSGAGINFYIVGAGGDFKSQGCFTGAEYTRFPITLVAKVALGPSPQIVTAQWAAIRDASRNSIGYIDNLGRASLSAVLGVIEG